METVRGDRSEVSLKATMRIVFVLLASICAVAGSPKAQQVDQDGLYREPFLVVEPGMHNAPINRLDADAAGRFLVTGSDDKTVRVWSAADGKLLRTIRI